MSVHYPLKNARTDLVPRLVSAIGGFAPESDETYVGHLQLSETHGVVVIRGFGNYPDDVIDIAVPFLIEGDAVRIPYFEDLEDVTKRVGVLLIAGVSVMCEPWTIYGADGLLLNPHYDGPNPEDIFGDDLEGIR